MGMNKEARLDLSRLHPDQHRRASANTYKSISIGNADSNLGIPNKVLYKEDFKHMCRSKVCMRNTTFEFYTPVQI